MVGWFNSEITLLRVGPKNKITPFLFPRRLRSTNFENCAMRKHVSKRFQPPIAVSICKLRHNFIQNILRNSRNVIKIQRFFHALPINPTKSGHCLLLPIDHRIPMRVSVRALLIAFHKWEPYLVGKTKGRLESEIIYFEHKTRGQRLVGEAMRPHFH